MNVNQTARRIIGLLLCLCLMACLAACSCSDDRPPQTDTPAPANHSGTFLSEYGSLTFNGDGQTITVKAGAAFAAASGLPAGENTGTYVFLFHNEQWRYDQAETLRITIDGKAYAFQNEVGGTDPDMIAFILPDGSTATFIKG